MLREARGDAVIRVAEEVLAAHRDGRGVVALETTLVAHGFPPGEGVEVGLAAERAVREAGSVPATVGVLDGEAVIGLTEVELARFDASARKVGPRDVAAAAVQGAVGATTEWSPKRFRLWVAWWNERALRAYRRAGFREVESTETTSRFIEMERPA